MSNLSAQTRGPLANLGASSRSMSMSPNLGSRHGRGLWGSLGKIALTAEGAAAGTLAGGFAAGPAGVAAGGVIGSAGATALGSELIGGALVPQGHTGRSYLAASRIAGRASRAKMYA
jgi:hypothetical protein